MSNKVRKHRISLPSTFDNMFKDVLSAFKANQGISATIRTVSFAEIKRRREEFGKHADIGEPRGIFTAIKIGDTVNIAYSLCNKSDVFNPNFGKFIACKRVLDTENLSQVPFTLAEDLKFFVERCKTYYKDAKNFKYSIAEIKKV